MAEELVIPVPDIRQVNKALNRADPALCECLKAGEAELVVRRKQGTGSVPMLRTWRKWMDETAKFMADSGCYMPGYVDKNGKAHGKRPFSAQDAHELFTMRWLGSDEQGNRLSWKMQDTGDGLKPAPKDRRLFAMDRHLQYCTERGIKLTVPREGEYAELSRRQEQ